MNHRTPFALLTCFCLYLWLLLFSAVLQAAPVVTEQTVLQAGFDQPTAVTVEAGGRVSVLDGVKRRVVTLSAEGTVLNRLENTDLQQALDMLAIPRNGQAGWLVADPGNHRLVWLNPVSGQLDPLPLSDGETQPEPVALAVIDDTVYWADRKTHRVCRLRWTTRDNPGCFGERGEGEGQFQYPFQMAVDGAGYLYVTDILNARIQVFDKTGRFFSQIGHFGLTAGALYRPTGLALDNEHERLFVSDAYFGTISVFEQGEYQGLLQDAQGRVLHLDAPSSLAFANGRLYVAETGASRVLRLSLTWTAEPVAATPPESGALSEKSCIQCHLSWAKDAAPDMTGKDADGVLPEASYRMCYSCHQGPVMDSRTSIHRGAQHPTLYESLAEQQRHARQGTRKDKLPREFPLAEHQRLSCVSCHTPHTDSTHADTLYPDHRNAWLRIPNRGGDLCERCHASKGRNARADTAPALHGLNHPLGIHLSHPPTEGAKGYASQPELHHGLPLELRQHGAATGPGESLICQSCHQVHGGVGEGILTVLPTQQGELCARCHTRQHASSREEAHHKGIHPVNFKPDKPIHWRGHTVTEITCATCHPVHQGQVGTSLLPEGIASAEALCQGCHPKQHAENREQARYKGIHPVNVKLEDAVTVNGQRQEVVTCLTCHAVHRGQADTAALVETDRNGELCSECHAHKQSVVGTDHDLRITGKTAKNAYDQTPAQSGVCGTCHTLHRGKNEQPALSAVRRVSAQPSTDPGKTVDDTPFQRDRLCLNCHQDEGLAAKKTIRHFSHPRDNLILRSQDKTMPLLDAEGKNSELGTIACVTCHEPHVFDPHKPSPATPRIELSTHHENREGTHSDSFLRRKGVSGMFCIDCHGQEGLIKYQYFHDGKRARGKELDYFEH